MAKLRMKADHVASLKRQVRFRRPTTDEMAELAREDAAKYGNANSPPASPLLATRLIIISMYERASDGVAASSTAAAHVEAIELAT